MVDESLSSFPAGCRVQWPEELNEVQACLVQGINEDLTARYLRAKYKSTTWKKGAEKAAKLILNHRFAYDKVEKETGLPWWLVGCLHMRESNNNFARWLANGDPLTGPTVNVPAGLKGPGNPPWEWHVTAIISLDHHNRKRRVVLKSIGEALDYAEHFNGLGYRQGAGRATTPPSTSPYLWSGTTEYERGKYVADGKFDADAVDAQLGVATVMIALEQMDIKLFQDSLPDEPPLPVTWFKLFKGEETNTIVGFAGATPVAKLETKHIDDLIAFRRKHPGANLYDIAKDTEKVPDINPQPAPIPKPEPKPNANPLDVKYYYQYANRFEPGATCGLTSAAMLLAHKGKSVTPDDLYTQFGKPQGQSPERLAALYKSFNLKSTHTYSGTYQDIRNAIDAGSPVVLHGYFTNPGHIVCVVGYEGKDSFIVNDPAGVWDGRKGSGYAGRPENGKATVYSIDNLVGACGRDKELWLSYTLP